jgi:VWFA-related protein
VTLRVSLCSLVWCLLSSGAATAQSSAPEAPFRENGAVVEGVEVSITNLDVVVTDARGTRVPDLTRQDFEVREDGKAQPITNFSEIRKGLPVLPPEESAPAEAASAALAPTPVPTPAPPRTRILVFVDNVSLGLANRNRVLKSLSEFLARTLDGSVETMVVSWDRALHVRQPFTTDADAVVRAVTKIEGESAAGSLLASERQQVIREIDDIVRGVDPNGDPGAKARAYCGPLRFTLQTTLGALRASVERLSGLEGRKILVYVSQGLPQLPGLEIWQYIDDVFQGMPSAFFSSREFDMTGAYEDFARAANAAGVAFYAVDATGLGVDASVSAENAGTLARINGLVDRSNLQSMMKMVAEETGGAAIVNANDVSPGLAKLAEDTTSYYSIGYRSTGGSPDRPRRISITLTRKGLVARTRRSLYEKSAETRLTEAVRSALFLPNAGNPLDLTVDIGPAKRAAGKTVVVPVTLRIPWARLALTAGGAARARLFVYLAALDQDGGEAEVSSQRLSPAQSPNEGLCRFEISMRMRPGRNRISLAVRDEASGLVSFSQRALSVSP